MKAFIVTPKGPVFEGEVAGVQMPGIKGGFEIREKHAKLVSLLDIGKLVVRTPDDKNLVYAISGGFTEVIGDLITVMAEEAVPSGSIDLQTQEEELREAESRLKKLKIDTEQHAAQERRLKIIKNLISIGKAS